MRRGERNMVCRMIVFRGNLERERELQKFINYRSKFTATGDSQGAVLFATLVVQEMIKDLCSENAYWPTEIFLHVNYKECRYKGTVFHVCNFLGGLL